MISSLVCDHVSVGGGLSWLQHFKSLMVFVVLPAEDSAAGNQTQCYNKNNVLVYKVETTLKVDSSDTVRVIAVERPNAAEVEVQLWKAVEGASIFGRPLRDYRWQLAFCCNLTYLHARFLDMYRPF